VPAPARSALLRLLQSLARRTRQAPGSAEAEIAASKRRQLAARRAAERGARRDLLLRGVALTATAALPMSRPAHGSANPPMKVAVVGGGLAGLAAAWRLAQAGVNVSVFEAAPRVGGRCWTERRAFDGGQIAERGGELIDTAHDEIIDLALALGLVLDDLHAATPRGTGPVWWIDGRRYDEAAAARDFERVWPALAGDARLLGDDVPTFARHTPAQRALDRTDAAQWLDSRVPGGRASPLGRLLANAYTEELGADLAEISAVTVVDLLRDSPRDRLSPYEESDQRYRVRGGNDLIVQRMAEALAGCIETGTRLVAIARRGDGRYRLAFARDQATHEAVFDHVVLAVPFTLLRDADLAQAGFRPRKLQAIRELGMGRNTKLQLQFDERAWIARGGSGETRIEGSYQVSWEVSRGQAGAPGILNFYSGGTAAARAGDGSPEERARDALADLDRIHPGVSARWNGRVIRNAWDRHPWSRGSYSLLKPGQYTAFHGIEHVPEGRVHFAGEQSSAVWYGYLNGAVESGLAAATAILRTSGQRAAVG
jgi:monoamine oxidase